MKKSILALSVTYVMLLMACGKGGVEEASAPDGKKIAVNLSAGGGETQAGTPVNSLAVPLSTLIKQLTFIVYNAETNFEAFRQTQFSDDPTLGQVSFNLPAGQYEFIAIGSKSEFGINKYFRDNETPVMLALGEANMQYWQPNPTMADKHYKTDDTFFVKQRVNVGSNQTVSLQLERIVGKLEVTVEDVAVYTVDVNSEAIGYMFGTPQSFGGTDRNAGYEVSSANGPISLYILRTDRPLEVEISAGPGIRKTLRVPIYKNMRTIVKGNLIDQPALNSFSVTINDKWLVDTTVVNL